jgi:hypothetical protein
VARVAKVAHRLGARVSDWDWGFNQAKAGSKFDWLKSDLVAGTRGGRLAYWLGSKVPEYPPPVVKRNSLLVMHITTKQSLSINIRWLAI